MKKILLTAAIFFSILSAKQANAQISFSLNIGSQPEWGPVGYDHADYYYMPDINTYYDFPAHQYVYFENNTWVRRAALPPRYSNYNLYNGYKVVVNERNPWVHNDVYRTKYASYRGRTGQTIIRDSREDKYRNHWNGDRQAIRNDRRDIRNEQRDVRNDRRDIRNDRKDIRRDEREDHRDHGHRD